MQMPCQGSLGGGGGTMFRVQSKSEITGLALWCPYCTRAHSNWSCFDQDVDDVNPLAN
jgi:hypothetical protein